MKKIKLIIASVAIMSLVSSSAVYADSFAPGEGLYAGAFVGLGTGMVQPKVTTKRMSAADREAGTFEVTDGGIGMAGIEGGMTFGYGYKMGDLYAGLETEFALGDVKFKITSTTPVRLRDNTNGDTGITEASATKDWTGGMFGRVGYYVNQDTLFSLRGGVLVSRFDVEYGADAKETFYGGGPSMGVDLSSRITAIDPNLSVRVGAVYTTFLTAPVSGIGSTANPDRGGLVDNEVTGSTLSARVGVQYSFFDVNSLF